MAKFKVGNYICHIKNTNTIYQVLKVDNTHYSLENTSNNVIFTHQIENIDLIMGLVVSWGGNNIIKNKINTSHPNIVNPIHYPDVPTTKDEIDRAFQILKDMCK